MLYKYPCVCKKYNYTAGHFLRHHPLNNTALHAMAARCYVSSTLSLSWIAVLLAGVLLVLSGGMLGAGTAHAQSLSVNTNDPDCDDATGTPSYCTIQAAVDAADPGDVIAVAAGVYSEQVDITESVTLNGPNAGISPNDANNPIDPNASRVDEAVIQPPSGSAAAVRIEESNVTLDGFTLDGNFNVPDGINNGVNSEFRTITNFSIQNNVIQEFATVPDKKERAGCAMV